MNPRLRTYVRILPVTPEVLEGSGVLSGLVPFPPNGKSLAAIEDLLNAQIVARCVADGWDEEDIGGFARGVSFDLLDLSSVTIDILQKTNVILFSLSGFKNSGELEGSKVYGWIKDHLCPKMAKARKFFELHQISSGPDLDGAISSALKAHQIPKRLIKLKSEAELIDRLSQLMESAFFAGEELKKL